MLGYFRKVTNTVLPTRSRNNQDHQESESDDDDDILFSNTAVKAGKRKSKKGIVLERQRSLKSKAEDVRTIVHAVDGFKGLVLMKSNPRLSLKSEILLVSYRDFLKLNSLHQAINYKCSDMKLFDCSC